MDSRLMASCGAYCGVCEWREKTSCPGCQETKGQMFWGQCAVATCARSKGLLHCGLCPDLPCSTLQEYFDHPEHGDNGERLANLRHWAKGEQVFVRIGEFPARQR